MRDVTEMLRAIIDEIRPVVPAGVTDAEIAREIAQAGAAMLAERDRSNQREWRDEIVARAGHTLRTRATRAGA